MLYNIAGIVLSVLTIFFLYVAVRIFFSKGWFKAWLRGSFAIFSFVIASLLVGVGLDLFSYVPYRLDRQIATLSVTQKDAQQYSVDLVTEQGQSQSYLVNGDLWQLDARLIVWSNFFTMLGLDTSLRLDRISGRYFSLEEEVAKKRTVYDLGNSQNVIDFWAFVTRHPWVPGIEARYGSSTYVPMQDGAVYSVHIRKDGLITKPYNDIAQKAIYGWQ